MRGGNAVSVLGEKKRTFTERKRRKRRKGHCCCHSAVEYIAVRFILSVARAFLW